MTGQLMLQPLQWPHRRRVLSAEQQREQRDKQADARPFEHHHEQRARQDGGQPNALGPEKRAKPPDNQREFAELMEGAQPALGYGIFNVQRASDDVVPDLNVGTGTFTRNPAAQLLDGWIACRPGKQPRVVDQDQMMPHRMSE